MSDDYSKTPQSIAEIRANRSELASLWTPRDALISALRDVDGKKVNPFVAFIVLGNNDTESGGTYTRFWVAGKNNYEIAGVAMRGLFMFEHDD
jgi:hypothetical protein